MSLSRAWGARAKGGVYLEIVGGTDKESEFMPPAGGEVSLPRPPNIIQNRGAPHPLYKSSAKMSATSWNLFCDFLSKVAHHTYDDVQQCIQNTTIGTVRKVFQN